MDPKLLFQLCEVIFQGSLSRAALSLHVTQPTLTRNMKAIEEAVGAPVLRRGRYGVTPTTLGERLAEQGRTITQAMALADDTVKLWRTGLVGEVRLGVGAMFSASQIAGFFDKHPLANANFSVQVISVASPSDLEHKLRNHKIDLAILPCTTSSETDNFSREVLFIDQICVMAGSLSPLTKLTGKIKNQQLAEQTWISINNMARIRHSGDQAVVLLGLDDVVPKFKFDGDTAAPIKLLRNSNMLALATRRFAEQQVAMGGIKILETVTELPQRRFILMAAKKHEPGSSVMILSNMIKDYFCDTTISPEPDTQTKKTMHVMDMP